VKTYAQTGKLVFTCHRNRTNAPPGKTPSRHIPATLRASLRILDLPAKTLAKPGDEFRYIWHCHVLEHEDNEMMRPYKIVG
jgi:FtsP/CotA-like multicopper oxidase with cupredoxin domain